MSKAKLLKTTLLALWLVVLALPALAQEVTVGGQVIMRFDNAATAQNVQRRIDALLEKGADPDGIVAKPLSGGSYGVFWGDTVLVEVSRELAKAQASSPKGLSIRWAEQLFEAVGPGLLRLSPARVTMPIGGEARVSLGGLATGQVEILSGQGQVDVTVDPATEELILSSRQLGKTVIKVKRGKGVARLPVLVKDWAGYPPDKVLLKVTGDPAPGDMVAEASLQQLVAETRVNEGCRLHFDGGLPSVPSVPTGDTLRYTLPIRIDGNDDYYPVVRKIPVEVSSLKLRPVESNLLLVSNRPERVEEDGVLLEYTFTKREPSRLMYSHMNETLAPRNLWVNLENPTSAPVDVLIGWTHAGPNRNEVHVGHTAAMRFLQQLGSNAGYVVTIAPRQVFELAYHDMGRVDLVSGFVNLRIIKGEKLRVEVLSALAPSRNNSRGMKRLGGPFNPFKIHPHGVFAQPFFEEWIDFEPGMEPIRVPYGKSPWLIDFETGLPNNGNFGVIYRYHFVLKNTTQSRKKFSLVFHPASGPAACSLWVSGKMYEARFRKRDVPALIEEFEVLPGQERTVDVVTVPEASSNYPAYLEIREGQSW